MSSTIYVDMQPFVPGVAYTFYTYLISQLDPNIFKTTVTLAAGDVKWSKDGAGANNITTLPTETGTSGLLTVTLSAAETTGVTKFGILTFHDAADSEWQDCAYFLSAQSLGVLSQSASSATAAMTGSDLAIVKGISYGTTLSGLTIPATWHMIYFTVKSHPDTDEDAQSVIQMKVDVVPDAATDGIVYLNGTASTATTRAYGTLVVNQAAGTVAVAITDEGTALMPAGSYEYDLKCMLADGSSTQLSAGADCVVSYTDTRT